MNAYNTIKDAIINRLQVTAMYQGYRREFCPHVLGTKHGREQTLIYQFAGESSQGPIAPEMSARNWRCVVIEELENVQSRKGAWHTGPKHTKRQTCVDVVDVEVAY